MTISPGDPGPTDPAAGGTPVPPYEGRRESADIASEEEAEDDGAAVGGAGGPVQSDELKSASPEDTPRGAVASPAEEQPAEQEPSEDPERPGEAATGPSHHPGTARGEDR